MTPGIGAPAPDFELPTHEGAGLSLASVLESGGAGIVFYPFAFSAVCGGELDWLKENAARIESGLGIRLLAISVDSKYALRAYAEQNGFPFPLLSDFWPHGEVAERYGVFDRDHGRAERGTFLVSGKGPDTGTVVKSLVGEPGRPRDLERFFLS